MKEIVIVVSVFVLSCAISYGTTAFILYETNPANWPVIGRTLCSVATLLLTGFMLAGIADYIIESKNKKP